MLLIERQQLGLTEANAVHQSLYAHKRRLESGQILPFETGALLHSEGAHGSIIAVLPIQNLQGVFEFSHSHSAGQGHAGVGLGAYFPL